MVDQGLIACSSCGELIGAPQKREGAFRLYKWSLTVQRSRGGLWETSSVQEVISAQLLALIEEQAVHKFLIYDGNIKDAKDALLVSIANSLFYFNSQTDQAISSGYLLQT